MKSSNKTKILILGLLVLVFSSGGALALPLEPVSNPDYRELRSDHVRDWYIFIDTDNNGILNPGDQQISIFQNWWSTKSSSTMHNQDLTWEPGTFPVDKPSSPMNWATDSNPAASSPPLPEENYWLPQKEDRMGFYMNYSQWNNCTLDHYNSTNYHSNAGVGGVSDAGKLAAYYREKYGDRNGYAMGWLTNKNNAQDPNRTANFIEFQAVIQFGTAQSNAYRIGQLDKTFDTGDGGFYFFLIKF